jgi:AcrR family transcriptional regulator
MARPTNADPKRTRGRVLGAAAEHFSSRGVEATSLREVAKSADVSLATINYYFGGKSDLYDACLHAAYDDLSRELAPLAAMFGELTERIRAAAVSIAELEAVTDDLVRQGLRFARARRPVLQLIMRSLLDNGELEEQWREGAFVPFLEETSRLLAEPLGRPALELRMMLQSLIALGMRYSLSTPRELARLAGVPEKRAVEAFEDHLVRVTHRMLRDG